MKDQIRSTLITLTSFMIGVIIGVAGLTYLTRDLHARVQAYTVSSTTMYNAVQTTMVLRYIKKNDNNQAIEALEAELDSNIVTLDSLRRNKLLENDEKDRILAQLKIVKQYRMEYPRIGKNIQLARMADEVLARIKVERQ